MSLVKSGKSVVPSVERAEQILFKKGFTVSNTKQVEHSTAEYELKTEKEHRLAVVKDLPDGVKIHYFDIKPEE